MKKALIIGAGPAGLTAAYELLKKGKDVEVVVFEESDCFGGISRTVEYKGNRMDMGGHRFFSKIPEVNAWWDQMLPMQGAPSYDDTVLDREVPLQKNGPDPEKEDRVMLTRHRVSRILFDDKFYDYPVSLKMETLKNMGFITTMKVGFSYLASLVHKSRMTIWRTFTSIALDGSSILCFLSTIQRICGADIQVRSMLPGEHSVSRGCLSQPF